MFKVTVLLFLGVSVCSADIAVTPPVQPRVLCGELPNQIFSCIGYPTIFSSSDAVRKCTEEAQKSQCDKMTCAFRNSGWMIGSAVNTAKVMEYMDQYAAEHPEWTLAVQHAKAACLAHPLPAQGYFLNCPAYDIMMCTVSSFIKNTQPSQWSSAAKCEYPRQFAAACPVCPQECFTNAIPVGSCNACYALPRSP